jgi:hypothetical protein
MRTLLLVSQVNMMSKARKMRQTVQGIEPSTFDLHGHCSTTELSAYVILLS